MDMPTTEHSPHPVHIQAAAFAYGEHGPAIGGVTPKHVMAVGSYLTSQGLTGDTLVATIGAGVRALIDDAKTRPTH